MKLVPKNKLLFWMVMVYFPFAALAVAVPETFKLFITFMGIFLILITGDALFLIKRFTGIHIRFPEVVRISKGRSAGIAIHIQNDGKQLKSLRLGIPLPVYVESPFDDMVVNFPKDTRSSFVSWPCTALKQGRYYLDKCFLEIGSPLGFWATRSSSQINMEIRSYPNLLDERKNLSALFMKKRLGIHSQRQLGKGRDFEQLREYMPGDSYEDIHWKATAKRRHPVTKVFQIERTQEVYIILDASRLSSRSINNRNQSAIKTNHGDMHTTILERFITASLVMGLAAEKQGDLFGLLTFTDQVHRFIKAKGGKAHYNTCRDTLYTLEPKTVTPDFSELFTFIGTHIRKRVLLIFLTSLDDPVLSESFMKHIDIISKRHVVLVNMLNPGGIQPVFSSSDIHTQDDIYAALGGHFIWERLRQAEKMLKRHNIGFSLLDNEKICVNLVSQYINIKQRQIL